MASTKKNKPLGLHSRVYTIAVKCYDEQLPYGLEKLKENIHNIDKADLPALQVLAIVHDRDIITDGIWSCPLEKRHIHLIVRCKNRKDRFYVSKFLSEIGIYFRPSKDDALWRAHGVESVGKFDDYAMYLTHETTQAIADGKERYELSEIISNLTEDEIKQVREGYIRVTASELKLSADALAALDKEAFDLGHELQDFNAWYDAQPFSVRSNTHMRTIKESYNRGVTKRIEEHQEINRICIFIHGERNTGKTYAAIHALQGKKVLSVGGGGTGKFDNLTPSHDAIVVDDDVLPNLLNIGDNYICRAYKRGKNNPAWAGEYLIVTSNLTFREWLEKCGIHTQDKLGNDSEHYRAMLSRFFLCTISDNTGYNQMYCEAVTTRGSKEDKAYKMKKFAEFKAAYNDIIKLYKPSEDEDYSYMIDTIPEPIKTTVQLEKPVWDIPYDPCATDAEHQAQIARIEYEQRMRQEYQADIDAYAKKLNETKYADTPCKLTSA